MRHPFLPGSNLRVRTASSPGKCLAAALALFALIALSARAAASSWPMVAGPDAMVEAGAQRDGEPPGPPPGVARYAMPQALPGRAGRLVDFHGTVWLFDLALGRWEEGLRNRALTTGDRLSTGPDGRAEVRIGSTELRLGPRTELEFVDIGEDRLVWRLATGNLAWRVRRHEIARESELRAAGVRVSADGPGHYRLDVRNDVVWASAWRGGLRVDSGDQLVTVGAGRRAEFMRPGPGQGTAVTWSAPDRDAFSDWVARDEARDDQLAAAGAGYVSPEMTGAEDLDRHGRWERHPEYGVVWTPLVVAAGWEPFRHGRWIWHARWGWTWTDAAAWGFAPFHYGRWVQWGGRWCWVPGPYLARPVFSPALVAWSGPPGPGVPIGVALYGRHWTPLPPRFAYPPPPRGDATDPRRRVPDPHGAPRSHSPHGSHGQHGPHGPYVRAPAPDERPRPIRPPRSSTPVEPVQSAPALEPVRAPQNPPPPQPLQPPREPAQVAVPARPAPAEGVDRLRRPEPGERAQRGGAGEAAERPRGGDRSNREERQESAAAAAPARPPARARVPEAMPDRPRERQQTM